MAKKTILVVEDISTIRESLKTALETSFGYEVITALDGANAIAILKTKQPDLDAAVLDIMMRGHGGSVKDYLMRKSKYKDIVIIYHTALDKNQFDNRILEGAYYTQKGSNSIEVIGALLQKLLG